MRAAWVRPGMPAAGAVPGERLMRDSAVLTFGIRETDDLLPESADDRASWLARVAANPTVPRLEPDDLGALTAAAAMAKSAAGRHQLGFRAARYDWPFRQSAPLLI